MRQQQIYLEGYFCGNCGNFMDDGVRYCKEYEAINYGLY
jgi:hypothetical protein